MFRGFENFAIRKVSVSRISDIFYGGKFLVSALEIPNELRLHQFHFRWTRFSETNNFRVEYFSKFASEGPQKHEFQRKDSLRDQNAISRGLERKFWKFPLYIYILSFIYKMS